MKPAPIVALTVTVTLLLGLTTSHADTPCGGSAVDVGSHRLWTDLQGTGDTTVVFEAGGGADSSVWAGIVPQVQALGLKTLVYDRAGLGRSEPRPGLYSVDRDTHDLRTLLDRCGVVGRVLVVSHSYGGFVSLLTAAEDRRVAGLVLVDANVPGYFTQARLDALLAEYRPRYVELREKAPQLAAAMIPMMRGLSGVRARGGEGTAARRARDHRHRGRTQLGDDSRRCAGDAGRPRRLRPRVERTQRRVRRGKLARRNARPAGADRRRDQAPQRGRATVSS